MSSASIPDSDPLPTVLVVEDEAMIRVAITDMLQEHGFSVLEAANANEAIEIIEKATVEIDVVFTDVRMPGTMDGFGLVKWIKNVRPSLPVIVASGDVGQLNDAGKQQLGDMFVAKPYDLTKTGQKIREAAASRRKISPT